MCSFCIKIVIMFIVENSDNKLTEYLAEFLNETFQSDQKVLYSTWCEKSLRSVLSIKSTYDLFYQTKIRRWMVTWMVRYC